MIIAITLVVFFSLEARVRDRGLSFFLWCASAEIQGTKENNYEGDPPLRWPIRQAMVTAKEIKICHVYFIGDCLITSHWEEMGKRETTLATLAESL